VLLIGQTVLKEKLPIETNLLALLPENQQDPIAQQAFMQITENLSNRVIFLIGADNKADLIAAAKQFSTTLLAQPLFSSIEAQLSEQDQQAWGTLYFPYRSQLLSDADRKNLQQAPQKRVQHVIEQVYNPFSGVTSNELINDPFLLFRDYLSTKSSSAGNFSLYKRYLITKKNNQYYLVIQANLAGDAYDSSLQGYLPKLFELESSIKDQFSVELLHAGTIFYAAYGTNSAKGEISTIGIGSLIGVILLLLLVYRSSLPLMLALFSITCGLVVAFVVTVVVFGKVHLFSLVFGASLIGVSIDYTFHYLTERLVEKENWQADKGLRHIFQAITLGLLTSLIGYLGLLIAPFPGLQQLSLFSVVGLASAYLSVVCCYPYLARSKSTTKLPNLTFLKQWVALWQNPRVRFFLPVFFGSASLIGLATLHFDDDIRQLQVLPQELVTQEHQIKEITGVGQSQKLLLVKADNDEALLLRLEALSKQFAQWQIKGNLGHFQSINQFVPSLSRQKENYKLVKDLYQSQSKNLSHTLGFTKEILFENEFNSLLVDDYLASPVSKPLGFLWLGKIRGNGKEKSASVVILNKMTDTVLLANFLQKNRDVIALNKANEISEIFAHYRLFISELLFVAYLFISSLLIWRYGVKLGVRVLIPPFIAAAVGLAITSFFAIPVTIFNLLALLLVLGIGIDYTLFFAERKEDSKAENTLLAISLSAVTTILSFGLLALSETQAIQGFGITVLTGIIVAWLLAPLAMKKQ
jgi:predicted exporter